MFAIYDISQYIQSYINEKNLVDDDDDTHTHANVDGSITKTKSSVKF